MLNNYIFHMFVFYPYLFDSKPAWEQTISDPRYRYDMSLMEFMVIYNEYKTDSDTYVNQFASTYTISYELPKFTREHTKPKEHTSSNEALLSQAEIDELLKSFT